MRTVRLALGLLVVAAGFAGCGGSGKRAGAAGSNGWTGGKRLGSYGILGECASATGPSGKLLVVCHSTESTAFNVSCWLAQGGSGKVLDNASWADAGSDPDCTRAERAVATAHLLRP